MPFSPIIKQLLQTSKLCQGSQQKSLRPAASTGYVELDNQLGCGGWPQAAISELLLSQHGIGEIRLLSPLLAKLSLNSGHITWINPPYSPYAPALHGQGLQLEKILVVQTKTNSESIWAAQQAMASQSSSAVLLWLSDQPLDNEIRKLNLAAQRGNCWGIILRNIKYQQQASAAILRIAMQLQNSQLHLSIIKQPGNRNGQKVCLNLFPERVHWNSLPAAYWPVFNPIQKKQQSDKQKTDLHVCNQSKKYNTTLLNKLSANLTTNPFH